MIDVPLMCFATTQFIIVIVMHVVIVDHLSVKEQICEQASYTLHHIDRAKLFTENSAMARLGDILRGWGVSCPPAAYVDTWMLA